MTAHRVPETRTARRQSPDSWSPRPHHHPLPARDALTGAPLDARFIIRWCTYDPQRLPGQQDPIPYDLHRLIASAADMTPISRRYAIGGCLWSRQAVRYFRHAAPVWLQTERGTAPWWLDPYIRSRVYRHCGREATDAALLILRDERPLGEAANRSAHNTIWLARQVRRVTACAARYQSRGWHTGSR